MIGDILRSMRPHQWPKNGFVLAGALFGIYARQPVALPDLVYVGLAFACFCCLSGAVYILNDVVDAPRDRLHPTKQKRPIASGRLPVRAALAAAGLAVVAAGALAWVIGFRVPVSPYREGFATVAGLYLLLNVAYSFRLKDVVIVDVLAIALGFVLRVAAGCLAIPVTISPWILVCTLLLALFLALCKRRHELILVGDGSGGTRKVLPKYSAELLNQMIAETTAAILVSYMLYTFQPHGARGAADPRMMLTTPFVVYGVWRYQYLAYRKDVGGSPEMAFRDVPFLVNLGLWVAVVVVLAVI